MKKQFLETGEIVAVRGLKGEVRVYPWSDSPQFLCGFRRFYLDRQGEKPLEVERIQAVKNMVYLKAKGIDTVEQAQRLRGKTLYIDRADCPLEEGDFFVQDLFGLEVIDADTGERYGVISDVTATGANDVYTIRQEGKADKLIPAIKEVVLQVDLQANRMLIRPLEGLFDEN